MATVPIPRLVFAPKHGSAIVTLALLCVGLIGCSPERSSPGTPPASQAASSAANPWLTDARLERARVFRKAAGLRADLAWIRQIAADPALDDTWGVPLTPAEARLLQERAATTDAITKLAQEYGASHPEAWGGVYVDAEHGGQVVVLVVGDPEEHLAALRQQVAPNAPLVVVQVEWTLAELQALRDRVFTDGWLLEHGYDLTDLGVNARRNLVELRVSTADSDAVEKIESHFDAGPRLEVRSDGTGVTSLASGTLRGIAQDEQGEPVPALDVELVSLVPGAGPRGDRGVETDPNGRFEIETTATTYDVVLLSHFDREGKFLEGSDRVVVGRARATLRPGEITFITVVVEPLVR